MLAFRARNKKPAYLLSVRASSARLVAHSEMDGARERVRACKYQTSRGSCAPGLSLEYEEHGSSGGSRDHGKSEKKRNAGPVLLLFYSEKRTRGIHE